MKTKMYCKDCVHHVMHTEVVQGLTVGRINYCRVLEKPRARKADTCARFKRRTKEEAHEVVEDAPVLRIVGAALDVAGTVYTGEDHGSILTELHEQGISAPGAKRGFITSEGRFALPRVAATIFRESTGIRKLLKPEKGLTVEDLQRAKKEKKK